MRLVPDIITTAADLVDFIRDYFPPEDARLILAILGAHFDEIAG